MIRKPSLSKRIVRGLESVNYCLSTGENLHVLCLRDDLSLDENKAQEVDAAVRWLKNTIAWYQQRHQPVKYS